MKNSVFEISEVGVQLPEWRVYYICVYENMYKCEEMVAHATF